MTIVCLTENQYLLPPSYAANNAALVESNHPTATLTLGTPAAFSALSFLCAAAGGEVALECAIEHADGSAETSTFIAPDWFDHAPFAYAANGRVNLSNRSLNNINGGNPRLYESQIQLANTASPIVNVSLHWMSGPANSRLAVFALSGVVPETKPPQVSEEPQSQTVNEGATVRFDVWATGTGPFGYQWSFNGTSIAGATDDHLILTNVDSSLGGLYSVTLANAAGTATSSDALLTVNPQPAPLFINEWLAVQTNTVSDPADGKYQSCFEVYNAGKMIADLQGYFFTDDPDNKTKSVVPAGYLIPPGGHLWVWADAESSQNNSNQHDLHVNFPLSTNGGTIVLSSPALQTVDQIAYGPQVSDVSQGRWPDGTTNVAVLDLTPRSANLLPDTNGLAGGNQTYDARVDYNRLTFLSPSPAQLAAETALRQQIPELLVEYDRLTGAGRSFFNGTGFLTGDQSGDAESVGLAYAQAHLGLLGLTPADIANLALTDKVLSSVSHATHLYYDQTYQGLRLYNGQLNINVNASGRILSVNSSLMPKLASAVNTDTPVLRAGQAVQLAAQSIGLTVANPPAELGPPVGVEQVTPVDQTGISRQAIVVRLRLLPIRAGEVRLVWNLLIETTDSQHVFDFTVDAVSGAVWTRLDQVDYESYKVYPMPQESPLAAPLDGVAEDSRTVVHNPADAVASPFGWHDTGDGAHWAINGVPQPQFSIMRGNNVHAYDDIDNDNLPPAREPECNAAREYIFPFDRLWDPPRYTPAAIANLFYWNNIVHDVQYHFGFDPAAGNFQVNNFGAGGAGGDAVNAEAQDGGGVRNANFWTPPDGQAPRMQMYLWPTWAPGRDGDMEGLIIVHEYGHGVSNRQVGGPANVNALRNIQQPGEGWSDFLGLAYTHRRGDRGPKPRGVGLYVMERAIDHVQGRSLEGPGIRPERYSTDPAVNDYTYESIMRFPPRGGRPNYHDVGSVWCEALWKVYWALVNRYGFSPNLYNGLGGSGNQRMMLYVNEGLKATHENPTFIDARNGIIQAAINNHGGADVCLIWAAFAAFGLGTDARSGVGDDPNTIQVSNGFKTPDACPADVVIGDGADADLAAGNFRLIVQPRVFDLGVEPNQFVLFGNCGPLFNGCRVWRSESIWVRNFADGGTEPQNPIPGVPNTVYARLRNNGPNVNPPRRAVGNLDIYYSDAALVQVWPGNWHLIQSLQNIVIEPGEIATVAAEWMPPNGGPFSLMAVWRSPQDPIRRVLGANMIANAVANNNVAWRNVALVKTAGVNALARGGDNSEIKFDVKLRNVCATADTVDVTLAAAGDCGSDTFWNHGDVYVDLGETLFSRWQAAGAKGEYIQVVTDQGRPLLQLTDPHLAAIRDIPLAYLEEFTVTNIVVPRETQVGVFQINEEQWAGGDSVGGFTWLLDTDLRSPVIAATPTNQVTAMGDDFTLSILANGTGPLSYQWYFNGVPIAGAVGANYSISDAQAGKAGVYCVVISNEGGSVTSAPISLTVLSPPQVTLQPQSQGATCHDSVQVSVAASGSGPFSFQWRRNGVDLAGATDSVLSLNDISPTDAGYYAVLVTGPAGEAVSDTAILAVVEMPPSLTIAQQGTNLVIRWPQTCATYSLEEQTDLNQPAWTASAATVVLAKGQFTATVPLEPVNRFYRLRMN